MPTMKRKSVSVQPDLFEQNRPGVLLVPLHKEHLAALVKTLLLEIAAALASGKVANDQDHGCPSGPRRFCLHPPVDGRSALAQSGEPPPSIRARRSRPQLGWTTVEVIDDDLGRSGGGVNRPGFERLLAAICEGRVGAVFAIEASRLARNGRDWHTLIEFCGLVGTIIVDEDGVYDSRHPNDRLLMGMKHGMSELGVSFVRQRSLEALKQKARRGELFLTVAIGYVKVRHNRIDIDPDTRVREAIQFVFRKFSEFQSIRQVHLWIRQEGILLPAVNYTIDDGRSLVWKLPVYNTIHHILTNPIYAGAYAFGRTRSRVSIADGRKRVVRGFRQNRGDWEVLIIDH